MDYHTQQHYNPMHQQSMNSLNLPDSSASSNEKALMWSNTQYMTESGYSTQAPSISSIDAFLNNEQMDSTLNNMDATTSVAPIQPPQTAPTAVMPVAQPDWNQPKPNPPPAYQQPIQTAPPVQPQTDAESDNAVANWMNSQDNSEKALKAIPDLLKLITDEDLIVVQQAAVLFNQMSRIEGPRLALIQTENAVQCLVHCLTSTVDLETARHLVGTLYNVSSQKPAGIQAIINSNALPNIIKMLCAPLEPIVSYSVTILHNVLLDGGDKVKMQMRKMGAIHNMIPLLNHNKVKVLSIVVDCLQLLAFGNSEAKQLILELNGTQALVNLLMNHQNYNKLLLNTTRLLKVLSVCAKNKQALVSYNAMQALAINLIPTQTPDGQTMTPSHDVVHNCLITLRNLSDAATRINGLEQLVANLLNILSTSSDVNITIPAAGILSNLTCNNENNKKAALKSNAVQILLQLIHQNMFSQKNLLLDPCVCALRHITNRHGDMLLAQEQVRSINGLTIIAQLMDVRPRSWSVIKAVLGLIRNFASNQLNANHIRANEIIAKLTQILYDSVSEIQMRTNNGTLLANVIKVDDVNLFDIVEACSSVLLILAKDYQNQMKMLELDCLVFFVQMFYSPIVMIQKAGSSLLAELSANKDCAHVISLQPNFNEFVQAHFCNQYGIIKTIAELTGSATQPDPNASTILQHVTTFMQKIQEHKNQRQMMYQQAPQRPSYAQQMQPQQQIHDQYGIPMHQAPMQQQMYYNNQMGMPSVGAYPQQQPQQQYNQYY